MAAVVARRRRACEKARPNANPWIEIRRTADRGRGVFAAGSIPSGTLIAADPVIIVPAEQCALLDKTILHDYYFQWDGGRDSGFRTGGCGALALGIASLCNHSRRPNARVRRNHAEDTLDLVALAPIAAGEEITIDYSCPLWFEAKPQGG